MPIPHWVPNDPEEALLHKSIRETSNPLTMPVNEATAQQIAVHQQEPYQLPCNIPQFTEGK